MANSKGCVSLSRNGFILYKNINNVGRVDRRYIKSIECELKDRDEIDHEEFVSGVFEESCFSDTMSDLQNLLNSDFVDNDRVVGAFSKDFYDEVKEFVKRHEVRVETKYKVVSKKVKLVALPFPLDCDENIARDTRKIGHEFIDKMTLDRLKVGSEEFFMDIESECFRTMFLRHEKTFAFESHEIGCVDCIVAPMVIFTISYMPWNLRPIPVPKAHLPKLVELLNEKIKMENLEPSISPYSNM